LIFQNDSILGKTVRKVSDGSKAKMVIHDKSILFPESYVLTLQPAEKQHLVENFHRFDSLKHYTVEPHVFTEIKVSVEASRGR
jgi:hypothetical protein